MDATSPPSGYRLEIRFVGSGSEYFRIWIVNLLLTLVTLGLYYPFAKVRRLRYFHAATEVGGHALSFHGDPWKMLRGYLLVGLLLAAYSGAWRLSPLAGLVALLILAALWPALWHVSLRFRLANTGWRGLRFAFDGSRGGAYRAMLPGGLFALAYVAIATLAMPAAQGQRTAGPAVTVLALLPLAMLLVLPALLWWTKRYQHNHYRIAGEHSRFTVPLTAAYGLALRTFGMALLFGTLVGVVMVAVVSSMQAAFGRGEAPSGPPWPVVVPALLVMLLVQATLGAFIQARMQNLVWNGTRSEHLAFDSRLSFRRLALLTARNWLLVIITLGLYFPFARIATARLRLQSLAVVSALEPGLLAQEPGARIDDASGDAAADLLGIDLGL